MKGDKGRKRMGRMPMGLAGRLACRVKRLLALMGVMGWLCGPVLADPKSAVFDLADGAPAAATTLADGQRGSASTQASQPASIDRKAVPQVTESSWLRARESFRVLGATEVSILHDPSRALTLADVMSPDLAARFRPLVGGIGRPYSDDAIWLRLVLQRAPDAPALWRLEVTTSLMNDVRLFTDSGAGGSAFVQAGDRFPFTDRPVPYRRPLFDLSLPQAQPLVAHLRLQTDSTLNLQLVLWQPKPFDAALQRDMLWIGGLFGIVVISMLFFLQAWVINRDRLLLAAAGVTMAFAATAASNLGLISQYLLPRHPVVADVLHPWSMAVFLSLLFALFGRALSLRALHPRLNRLQWLASVLCIAAACLKPVGLYGAWGGKLMMLGMLLGLAWVTLAAWLVWRARRRGLATAVALTCFTTTFALAPMVALDLLPSTRHFELFWVLGSVGFILLAQSTTLDEVRRVRGLRREAIRREWAARRQAEQELIWRREQARYFAGVAHDLRTPLSAVRLGLANLARQLMPMPDAVGERLLRLQASSRRAADMIERHLQLQRLEQPDIVLMRTQASVEDCLAQVRTEVVEVWPETPVRIQVLPGAPQRALIDVELVVRALTNLVSNAAKAAPPGTPVTIDAVGDGAGGVGFLVADQGPGLGDVPVETLFSMHWRRTPHGSQPGANPWPEGFGIGLPMVHRIATLHQGRVTYRRLPQGFSEFAMWLPTGWGFSASDPASVSD